MIIVENLSKHFGDIVAVDDLSFRVEAGEVLGFLGPNGAGKSTTMKMITGYLRPSAGRIEVCGHDVRDASVKARGCIGYLPEGAPCYGDMSVRDFLFFIGSVRRLSLTATRGAVAAAIDRLELGSVMDRRIQQLSKGFKRRVGLAQAILHDPRVLILDEPTDGLDPNQKHQVRDLITRLSEDKIIVISTHILEEVTAVCSRAVIINEGRLVTDERPSVLVSQSKWHNVVRVRLSEAREVYDQLASVTGVVRVERADEEGLTWLLFPRGGKSILREVQGQVETLQLPLEAIYVETGQLDDVFREVTRGSLA